MIFGDLVFQLIFAGSQNLGASSWFIYDEKRSKSSISDKDIFCFQVVAKMRGCDRDFSK